MDSETWLEKATRLQRSLVCREERASCDDDELSRQRIKIALWLRREFSPEIHVAEEASDYYSADR